MLPWPLCGSSISDNIRQSLVSLPRKEPSLLPPPSSVSPGAGRWSFGDPSAVIRHVGRVSRPVAGSQEGAMLRAGFPATLDQGNNT